MTAALGGRVVAAEDLQIAGMVPMSSVDWPGRLVATVFTQGCPWRCGYCQNTELIDPRTPGQVTWAEVRTFLGRRQGLLDGVVLSGGEATRQAAADAAAREIRGLGFGVGLHTAGAYPGRLARLLPLVDFVGLDVKAMPDDYAGVVGRPGAGARAWESLDLALAAHRERGIELEVRLTVHPGGAGGERAVAIARRLAARGVPVLALQEARTRGTTEEFTREHDRAAAAAGPAWFAGLVEQVRLDWPGELIVRPA